MYSNIKKGKYEILPEYTCDDTNKGSSFTVTVDDEVLTCNTVSTGGYEKYSTMSLGKMNLNRRGKFVLTISPDEDWKPIRLIKVFSNQCHKKIV
jgi:hypothetical protein